MYFHRVIGVILLGVFPVGAQTLEWDADIATAGAQGGVAPMGWSSGPVWWNGTTNVNWTNGSDAVFGGTTGVVLNDAAVTVDDINFVVPGYVLQANGPDFGVRLGGGEGAHVITVAGNAAINHRLLGTEGFSKEGLGVLALGNANHSFIGTITIAAGEVKIAGGFIDPARSVVLANVPGAQLTVDGQDQIIGGLSGGGAAGGEVRLNGSAIVGQNNTNSTYDGVVTGNGSLVKRGTGVLSLTNSNSTYSGPTYLDEGILSVDSLAADGIPSALGLSSYIKVGNGATLRYAGTNAVSTDRRLEFIGTGAIDVAASEASVTLEGQITGGLQKTGAGTLHFNPVQTYSGAITVAAGILKVSGSQALSATSSISLSAGTVLDLVGSTPTIGSISGSGNVQLGTGTHHIMSGAIGGVISGPGGLEKVGAGGLSLTGANTFTGPLRISEGTVSINSENAIPPSASIVLGSATSSGKLANQATFLVLNGPVTVSPGGGRIDGRVGLNGPIEGNSQLFLVEASLVGDKAFGGTIHLSGFPNSDGASRSWIRGNLPNATVVVDGGYLSTAASVINLGGFQFRGRGLFPGDFGSAGTTGTIYTKSLLLNGGGIGIIDTGIQIEIEGATSYDHFEVEGPVTLDTPMKLTLFLKYDPVDNADIIRLIVNDGSDPTVRVNSGMFVYNGNFLEEGETFFVPQTPPGSGPAQQFQIHYGLDGTDNDVRLVAIPEASPLLILASGLPLLLSVCCRPRRGEAVVCRLPERKSQLR